MAVTLEQKVDFLLKKFGYVAAKTGAVTGSASGLGQQKGPTQEAIASPLIIPSSTVWGQSDSIPSTPPTLAGETGVVYSYIPSSPLQLTLDPTVSSNRTWLCHETFDDTTSTLLGNWIDGGNFGPSYYIKVYKNDPTVSANELYPNTTDNEWFFDYSAGVLNFNDSNIPYNPASDDLYLVGYRYIGETGHGNASITISENPPSDPNPGEMWWNSTNGDLLIYYDDGQIDGQQGSSAQWVSAMAGGGGFFTLDPATSTISTPYNLTALSKNFRIDHPLAELRETHDLAYVSVEGPSADLLFHGTVQLVGGKATINIDNNSNQTEGTFESLCKKSKCFTTNTTDWTPVRGKVVGNNVLIEAKDDMCDAIIDWMVIGTRNDSESYEIITSDRSGNFYPEILKGGNEVKKYSDPITISGIRTK